MADQPQYIVEPQTPFPTDLAQATGDAMRSTTREEHDYLQQIVADADLTEQSDSAETRAKMYANLLVGLEVYGYVPEDWFAVLINGLNNDQGARDWLKKQPRNITLPTASDVAATLWQSGSKDQALFVNQVSIALGNDHARAEPLQDMAIMSLVMGGVQAARQASVYGWKAVIGGGLWMANSQSRGAWYAGTKVASNMKAGKWTKVLANIYNTTPEQLLDDALWHANKVADGQLAQIGNTTFSPYRTLLATSFGTGMTALGIRLGDVVINREAYTEGDARAILGEIYRDEHVEDETALLVEARITGKSVEELQATHNSLTGAMDYTISNFGSGAMAQNLGGMDQALAQYFDTGQRPTTLESPGTQNSMNPGEYIEQAGRREVRDNLGKIKYDEWGQPILIDLNGTENLEQLDQIIAQIETAHDSEEDPLIGTPPGFVATTVPADAQRYDAARRTAPGTPDYGAILATEGAFGIGKMFTGEWDSPKNVYVPARYKESDVNKVVFNLSPRQVESLQRNMERAGLINTEEPGFLWGSADEQTRIALMTTMGHANRVGRDWRGTLEDMGRQYQEHLREQNEQKAEKIKPLFVPQSPYVPLDPETVRQRVQADVERQLGRKANDWEMAELAGYMEQNHRTNYDNRVEAERAIFEATGRAEMGEDPGPLPTLKQVDEDARYEAKFEERYATELDETDRWGRMKQDTQTLFQGLDRMSSQMGGV